MSEPWKFKPQYPTFEDMQAAHAGAKHIQLVPPAGLYLTRGDGTAVPVTAAGLHAAMQAASSSSLTEPFAERVIAKLLEADHG